MYVKGLFENLYVIYRFITYAWEAANQDLWVQDHVDF